MQDPFATCTEQLASTRMRHGIFEWETEAELSPGLPVTLMICWQPEFDGSLAEIVVAARQSWARLPQYEMEYRQAAAADVSGAYRWMQVNPATMIPATIAFQTDGSVEIDYTGIETGGHGFVVEVSPTGEYLGHRIE